jgi:hypothetical protein
LNQQCAHLFRLLLLHPMPGAIEKMESTMRVQALLRILSTAPGV